VVFSILKPVKRISSSNKSGPFIGSEFAFEDLSSFEIEKYSYNYLGDETINGIESFKVERYLVDKNSGYKRRIVWVDKAEYRVQKIDFYDCKNTFVKTLSYLEYQHYLGQYWRATTIKMVNHQNGKTTALQWSNYQFKVGLSSSYFNKNVLKRVR
jgi:outer membrane lipoprotein-sorting protein